MPTKKPRLMVTLDPAVYETLARLAELQGCSRSRVVSDLLESIHPPLQRTVALLDAAREAPQQVKDGLRSTVEDLERDLSGQSREALGQLDWVAKELGMGAEEGGSDPRPCNTGVTYGGSGT